MVLSRIQNTLLGIGIVALLQGCASMATGPLFDGSASPPTGQAVIYVFRPDQSYARGNAPDLTVDGAKVGVIHNAGFLKVDVQPGRHTVDIPFNFWTWGDHCAPAIVKTNAGETHYVNIELAEKQKFLLLVTAIQTRCVLKEISADEALPLIKQTRLSQQ
jgi:hypothetical protein